MQTTESCRLCEKVVVVLEARRPLASIEELPSTRDRKRGTFAWKQAGLMAYALVPRAVQGTTGIADMYLCLDEDDLDDIDILEYAGKVFREKVFPGWNVGKDVQFLQPSLSPPVDLPCWKLRHEVAEGS